MKFSKLLDSTAVKLVVAVASFVSFLMASFLSYTLIIKSIKIPTATVKNGITQKVNGLHMIEINNVVLFGGTNDKVTNSRLKWHAKNIDITIVNPINETIALHKFDYRGLDSENKECSTSNYRFAMWYRVNDITQNPDGKTNTPYRVLPNSIKTVNVDFLIIPDFVSAPEDIFSNKSAPILNGKPTKEIMLNNIATIIKKQTTNYCISWSDHQSNVYYSSNYVGFPKLVKSTGFPYDQYQFLE